METKSQGNLRPVVTVLALLLLIGGTVWGVKLYRDWTRPPQPPEVNPAGVEPDAARMIADARQGVLNAPGSGSAWGKLGQVLLANSFFQPAARSFVEAERLQPYEPRWPYLRGRALQEEKPEEAVPALRRAASMAGAGTTAPRLTLAELLIRRNREQEHDLRDAEALVRDVLGQDPFDARALLDMGRIEHARGRDKEALDYLKRAARLAPDAGPVFALLANVQERLGQHAAAQLSLRQGAGLPDDPAWSDPFVAELVPFRVGERADLEYGQALLADNRNEELAAFARKTVGKYPRNPMAWEQLGKALARTERLPQAENAFRHATDLAPDSLRPLLGLILTLGLEQKFEDVETQCRKAIALRSDAAEPHYYLGAALGRRGKWEEAMVELREAVRLRPDVVRYHDGLGETWLKVGNADAAAAEFRESLKIAPTDPLAKYYMQNGLDKLDRPKQ